MILGRHQQPHTPFVPVIEPQGEWEYTDVVPLFGETEDEAFVRKQAAELASAKRTALIFGLAGVAIASIVTGGVAALSFRSYARSGSILGPAIYMGLGSAAAGTAVILIASRAVGGGVVDSRAAALAGGIAVA